MQYSSSTLRSRRSMYAALLLATMACASCSDDEDANHAADMTTAPMADMSATPDASPVDSGPSCGDVPTGTVSLASTMDPGGRIVEFELTEALAIIERGDGGEGDADGLYPAPDGTTPLGSPIDVFPREGDFQVGSLSFDATGATGCGEETFAVTALDLSELWAPEPAVTDLSDVALRLWFFERERAIVFGPVDDADTVTFRAGRLTSLDVEITMNLDVDYTGGQGQATTYAGQLRFAGDQIALQIDDMADIDADEIDVGVEIPPTSRLVIDLTGTVNAVTP